MTSASSNISQRAEEFVARVLRVTPQIAAFDCDGTLWDGDMGAGFFYWEIEQGLIPAKVAQWALPRYDDYKAGRVDEETMCGEMVTIHATLPERTIKAAAQRFFELEIRRRIFPEMRRLTQRLAESGCQSWAVSSTNAWVIRAAAPEFHIPAEHVIAACVHIEDGCATDRLLRVPTDEGKAVAIRQLVDAPIDSAFGNSIHDAAMLELAGAAFAVNPNPDLQALALRRGWTVYRPDPL